MNRKPWDEATTPQQGHTGQTQTPKTRDTRISWWASPPEGCAETLISLSSNGVSLPHICQHFEAGAPKTFTV